VTGRRVPGGAGGHRAAEAPANLHTTPQTGYPRPVRLRRSDCSGPGIRRLRRGRGFSYLDQHGNPVTDEDTLVRIRELAIPPAWQDVWICSDPRGHLQATGTDGAGRKQYLYHSRWRERRDREKFERALRFAHRLPRLREQIHADLEQDDTLSRERVLACAARLLDRGLFRVGSEQYADEDGGYGLATIRREHVSFSNGSAVFDYPGKSGVRRVQAIDDPQTAEIVRVLRRRRPGKAEEDALLAYRNGRRWVTVRSDDINEYLKAHIGEEFSAKDFRTWNATVMAAIALATDARTGTAKPQAPKPRAPKSQAPNPQAPNPQAPPTKTSRKRHINAAVKEVAEVLGNTPAVARRSYIDPRVFDRYQAGATIAPTLKRLKDPDLDDEKTRQLIERAVLRLLKG
jgi:DNA topoisomerase I